MSLKITNSEVDGVSLVALSGRIVWAKRATLSARKLKGLIAAGKRKIVLNMAEIEYIDSSGLGALVARASQRKKMPVPPNASAISAINSTKSCS